MNFDRLRQLLIQKAIEGKLVSQYKNESVIEQIGETPDEIPFAIPDSWKWVPLDNLTFNISDGSHNPPPNIGPGSDHIPVLSAKNVINGQIDFASVNRWTSIDEWAYENKKCPITQGDVVLTIVGTIGRTAIINTAEKFIFQRSVCIIKNSPLVLNDYLVYVLNSSYSLSWMMDRAAGTAQKGVYLKTVKQLLIPLPPIDEQRRIVARLNELLSVIKQAEDAYTDLQSLGKTLRERILQKAIEGKLVPQIGDALAVALKNENTSSDRPFEIPYKWKWCKLKDIAVSFDYGTSEKCHNDKNVDDIAVLRMSNITRQGDIDFSNLKYCSANSIELPKLFAHQGDLLFNRTNSIDLVGKCAVYRGEESKFSFASYIIRVALKDCDPTFIAAYINSDICRQTQILPNTSQQVGQANFGGTKLKNVLVPIPPLEEQRRIVAKLNELLPLVDQMTAV